MMATHPNLERFLSLLRKVSRAGAGAGWLACCPAHGDEHPSLSVSIGHTGGIVVHCHSQNCSAESIAMAVGMKLLDFAPDAAPEEPKLELTWGERIEATYDYQDEAGEVLYQVCRLHSPKEFKQRKKSGTMLNRLTNQIEKLWSWKLGDVRRVPYRLPELLAADPQQWRIIVEGEKDADNLRKIGFLATTNAQGAGKWGTLDDATVRNVFSCRKVAIIPDNDKPGLEHAIQIAEALETVASELRVVTLPGLPLKGDVSDWLMREKLN